MRSKWMFAGMACTLVLTAACVSHVSAAIIASEDFESYTPVPATAGLSEPDFGDAGENGGAGWTSAWTSPEDAVFEYVRSNLFTGYGQGLEIAHTSSGRSNIVVREFPTQTDDFYVGLTMRAQPDGPGANDFTKFWLTDSPSDGFNDGFGAGTTRVSGPNGPGLFYSQNGDAGGRVASTVQQVYGEDYNVVFKISKSGSATDPFDKIDTWVDQATEGTPDATATTGTSVLTDLSAFHVWFDDNGSPGGGVFGHLMFDNLVIATTYDDALSLANNPIPEPSAVMALCVGLAVVATGRRRK